MDDFSHVTLCFTTPRSRSQWLTALYGSEIESWHDPLKHCTAPRDLKGMIENRRHPTRRLFIADTSAVLFHRALLDALPGMRCLYVRRPALEVAESLKRQLGFNHYNQALEMYERVTYASGSGNIGSLCDYKALDVMSALWWEGITGTPRPKQRGWWSERFKTKIDMPLAEQAKSVDPDRRRELMRHVEP